jgi:hypothetical protein
MRLVIPNFSRLKKFAAARRVQGLEIRQRGPVSVVIPATDPRHEDFATATA